MLSFPTFQLYGPAHLAVLAATIGTAIGLAWLTKRAGSPKLTKTIAWVLASVLVVNELIYCLSGFVMMGPGEAAMRYLPLHICGFAVYLTAAMLLTRRQWVFELAFYWALAGTVVAMVVPDLAIGFPHYWFWQFFIRHSGVIIGVAYAVWGLNMRPRVRSALWAFAATNVWLVFVAGMNVLTGGNYMYLSRAPAKPAWLAQLSWPWYLVVAEAVLLASFVLLERVSRRRIR